MELRKVVSVWEKVVKGKRVKRKNVSLMNAGIWKTVRVKDGSGILFFAFVERSRNEGEKKIHPPEAD
jgi:hypothetical protein